MALAKWQRTIVDNAGNVLPSAAVTVRLEAPGAPLASLFSDRAGTVPLSNPFNADGSTGFAAFHVVGGCYRIDATKDALSHTWRHVGIGTAQEGDGPTPAGLSFGFSTVTTDTAPPAGFIAINSASFATATYIYVSKTDRNGRDVGDVIARGFASTNGVKAHTRLTQLSARPVSIEADVSALIVDGTTYYKIPLVGSSVEGYPGAPSAGEAMDFIIEVAGDAGLNGSATAQTVELNFGTTPVRQKTFIVAAPGVAVGQKILAAWTLDMPAGVAEDEFEFDIPRLAAKVHAAGQVKVIVVSDCHIAGKRNVNLSIY